MEGNAYTAAHGRKGLRHRFWSQCGRRGGQYATSRLATGCWVRELISSECVVPRGERRIIKGLSATLIALCYQLT